MAYKTMWCDVKNSDTIFSFIISFVRSKKFILLIIIDKLNFFSYFCIVKNPDISFFITHCKD